MQAENDNLVLKILHIRSGKGNTHASTFQAGQSRVVTMAQRRSLSGLKPQKRSQSAQSSRSARSARNKGLHSSILEEEDKRRKSEDERRQQLGVPRSRSGLRRQVNEIRKQKAYNDLILKQLTRSASVSSRHRSSSASKRPLNSRFTDIEGIPEHSKLMGGRKRLINVGNIQIDEHDLKKRMHRNMIHQLKYNASAGPGARQLLTSSTKNLNQSGIHGSSAFAPGGSGHNSSLNYIMRRKEQTKQIEENIQMLKRIHFARPTINYQSQQKHAEKADQLKKRIQNSGSRYAMVQAAREVILKAESQNDAGRQMREKMYSTKNRHGKMTAFGNGLRVSSSSAQRRSFKATGSRKDMPQAGK